MGDIDALGRLFDLAHGMLAGLRLSTLELERLVHGARAAGAIGAKLTGAGGGGAVIALAPSHRQDVLGPLARRTASTGLEATRRMSAVSAAPAATARAGTNIALVKYWGKRDAALNLPATGSLSLTLAELGTDHPRALPGRGRSRPASGSTALPPTPTFAAPGLALPGSGAAPGRAASCPPR